MVFIVWDCLLCVTLILAQNLPTTTTFTHTMLTVRYEYSRYKDNSSRCEFCLKNWSLICVALYDKCLYMWCSNAAAM